MTTDLTIKADRKKAFIRMLPFWLVFMILAGFWLYTKNLDKPNCEHLIGINISYLYLLLICYVIPVLMFIASLFGARIGYKEMRYGYSPPLDSVVFIREIEAKTGKWVRFKGAIYTLLPVFCIYLIYLGNTVYFEMTTDLPYSQYIERIESDC